MKPRIRIKGFDGDWNKVKAGTIFTTTNERNHPELPVLSATQDKGMVTRDTIGYTIFHDKSNEATYKRILPGQFTIHLRSFQGGFAHSSIEGICSPAYTILSFKDKGLYDDIYWKYVFTSRQFIKSLELITYGIRDGRSINFNEFMKMNFWVPSLCEQRAIASYFTHLDELISASTSRLASLKQIKAASLQTMFPQEGETTPRLRFKGFEGKWNKVRFEDLFDERNIRGVSGELLSVTMENGVIRASENGKHDISSDDKSNYKYVEVGDIAYNSMRMWQGASGCSSYSGIVSPAYTVIVPKGNANPKFFAIMFKTPNLIHRFRMNSQGLTSDTWKLKYPELSKNEVLVPEELEEQRIIAKFYNKLDAVISLETQRLEKLKQIKAACLDGMFA